LVPPGDAAFPSASADGCDHTRVRVSRLNHQGSELSSVELMGTKHGPTRGGLIASRSLGVVGAVRSLAQYLQITIEVGRLSSNDFVRAGHEANKANEDSPPERDVPRPPSDRQDYLRVDQQSPR
jgi:hypothetical protein